MTEESKTTALLNDLREYISAQVEITKLKVVQGTANFAARMASMLVAALLAALAFSILTVSAGLWLGTLFHDTALGFLILGSAYLLILALVVAFREQLIHGPVRNKVINTLLNENRQER